eukprot:TRINITY_DN43302_c0_g1_i1.p2 TRINITY_DN43302_c0_g1~~TRINITY_DN43302_c0_g1_i1.p2  ORF type:complete len:294 (+),score=87.07 TRINITY_DN43302_c0_g1_i1:42-923(+)
MRGKTPAMPAEAPHSLRSGAALLLHVGALAVPALIAWFMARTKTFQGAADGERWCITVALSLGHLVCYWLANAYYLVVARVPELHAWQIPHQSRQRGNTPELLRKALIDAALSTLLIGPVLTWFAYPAFVHFGVTMFGEMPSVGTVCRDLLLSSLFTDTTFYWSHRLLHHPRIYASVHKQHHEFKAVVGWASEYDHPLEDAVNTLSTVGGPILLGSHGFVLVLYTVLRVHQTVDSHSGYSLPWPYSLWAVWPCKTAAVRHDYHHTDNLGNYGDWLPFWDWLCGTDRHWRAGRK